MAESLLAGIRVVDLTGEPGAIAGRILADLGADVTKVEPLEGDPLRTAPPVEDDRSVRHRVWTARSTVICLAHDDPELDRLLDLADIVVATPGWPGVHDLDPGRAPEAAWVSITPFGATGPRAGWRASDLGVLASSGNLYPTRDPDRPPVRCAEPVAYAHTGPEAVFAALSALASGRPQQIDLSMQEAVMVASMGAAGRYVREKQPGRRRGANMGRTREIWPCADGFVSFGLRGGKARIPSLETISRLVDEEGLADPPLAERDWSTFDHVRSADDDLASIESAVGAWFARHTMAELYAVACDTNLMLAPINSPRELLESEQLAAREVLGPVGDLPVAPVGFVKVHDGAGPDTHPPGQPPHDGAGAWAGTRIIEFGAGAAGPIATRYFADHGADVIRVESRVRPDFLRTYGTDPDDPDRLERAPLFDALNPGKRSVALNLKAPEGHALALRLVQHADAVAENFAPRAMRGLGLGYDDPVAHKPDLVMVSACLNGQTGPHRDYPGFGGQGSALAGFNFLTGWPDREPLGPFGTITDSLAPRFSAAALAAALLRRRRTGRGTYLDLSQVEAGLYALSPWLVGYERTGEMVMRSGNRTTRAVPHGLFPCAGEDRWVAVAAWTDDEWARLAHLVGVVRPEWAMLPGRLEHVDEVEATVAAWTTDCPAIEVAEELQGAGIEAVPVSDFADASADAQLRHRDHFIPLEHPIIGPGEYERNGFRLSDAPSGYHRPTPLLGEDEEYVLGEILGLDAAERERLRAVGVLD